VDGNVRQHSLQVKTGGTLGASPASQTGPDPLEPAGGTLGAGAAAATDDIPDALVHSKKLHTEQKWLQRHRPGRHLADTRFSSKIHVAMYYFSLADIPADIVDIYG